MIIKVNYTVSDIYMSTSVSAVYIKVVYSGVSSGGGGTWGTITGTLSAQTDLQTALDLKVPYSGATGAVNLGAFGITAASLIKSGGTSSQFLKADGSVDSSTYTPTSRTLTINGTTQDLTADRTFTIATANIYNADGTLTSARTLTSGGFPLTFTGTNTAASAIARGLNLTHTLIASANSDVLVGLDINPTFTNGAFTGVNNYGLRLLNSQAFFGGLNQIAMFIADSSAIRGNATTNGTLYFDASRDTSGTLNLRATTLSFQYATLSSSEFNVGATTTNFNTGLVILKNSLVSSLRLNNTTSAATWYFENNRNAPSGSLEITNNISNAGLTLFPTRNVGINTNTDGGFKLDVNGTARVSGALMSNGKIFAYGNSTTGLSGLGAGLVGDFSGGRARLFGYDYGASLAYPISIGEGLSKVYLGSYDATISDTINIIGNVSANGDFTFTKTSGNIIHNYTIGGTTKFILGTNSTLDGFQIYNSTIGNRALFFPQASGNVIVNGTTDVASAQLQVSSTTKGFLPPRLTTTQINAIATPAEGLQVYNTTINHMCFYMNGAWAKISHSPM